MDLRILNDLWGVQRPYEGGVYDDASSMQNASAESFEASRSDT